MSGANLMDGWVEAPIARGRVKEMTARGWRVRGPIHEGFVMMVGPDPDLEVGGVADDWAPLAAFSAPPVMEAPRRQGGAAFR